MIQNGIGKSVLINTRIIMKSLIPSNIAAQKSPRAKSNLEMKN